MNDPRTPVFDAIKTARGRSYTQLEVAQVHTFLDSLGVPRESVTILPADPAWVKAGRTKIGEREIPGPKNNAWIAQGWAKLGASWFNDDETPWCGFFTAWCMQQAGIPYPMKGEFARALAWAKWGVGVPAGEVCVGTVMVKTRNGGGHVGMIVGETPDKRYWKVLGGNQNNMVSITDILKDDVVALRWPASVPLGPRGVPTMARGVIGASEA